MILKNIVTIWFKKHVGVYMIFLYIKQKQIYILESFKII